MRQNDLKMNHNATSQGNATRTPCPVMNYQQFRRARRLIREECCNYDNGECFLLDEGEGCVCVQSISYTLLCKWFRTAVLPLDKQLEGEILYSKDMKPCAVCGKPFLPGSNRAKYCAECARRVERVHATQRKRKERRKCHDLESREPL